MLQLFNDVAGVHHVFSSIGINDIITSNSKFAASTGQPFERWLYASSPAICIQLLHTTLPFLYEYKKGVFLATYSFLFSLVIHLLSITFHSRTLLRRPSD